MMLTMNRTREQRGERDPDRHRAAPAGLRRAPRAERRLGVSSSVSRRQSQGYELGQRSDREHAGRRRRRRARSAPGACPPRARPRRRPRACRRRARSAPGVARRSAARREDGAVGLGRADLGRGERAVDQLREPGLLQALVQRAVPVGDDDGADARGRAAPAASARCPGRRGSAARPAARRGRRRARRAAPSPPRSAAAGRAAPPGPSPRADAPGNRRSRRGSPPSRRASADVDAGARRAAPRAGAARAART